MRNRCTEEPYQKEEKKRQPQDKKTDGGSFPGLLGSSKSSPGPKNIISFPVAAGSALERGQHARTSDKTVGMGEKSSEGFLVPRQDLPIYK